MLRFCGRCCIYFVAHVAVAHIVMAHVVVAHIVAKYVVAAHFVVPHVVVPHLEGPFGSVLYHFWITREKKKQGGLRPPQKGRKLD